ncbi:MAG: hypothetical protein AAF734_00860 [Bacteroidota bacterium]
MASGFIILKDGRGFARRWTSHDELLSLAIKELVLLEGGQPLADWLALQMPVGKEEEGSDAGWGFYNVRIEQWINRVLDVRSLTATNQSLFWEAICNVKEKLSHADNTYSCLSLDLFNIFYRMYECAERGEPPLELTDLRELAAPCTEKNGPGWE